MHGHFLLCVQFFSDGGGSSGGLNKRDNPHKYLLYKPTFSQLFTFLASGFKELPPTGQSPSHIYTHTHTHKHTYVIPSGLLRLSKRALFIMLKVQSYFWCLED